MQRATFALLALSLLAANPAAAHGSWAHCGEADVEIDLNLDTIPDAYLVTTLSGIVHYYEELNQILHLQRGGAGESCDETMQGLWPADLHVI